MRKLVLSIVLGLCAVFPLNAQAQSCDTLREVIVTLKPPLFGFPSVWDVRYQSGEEMTQFGSGVLEEGGSVMTIGRTFSGKDFKPKDIILTELNRRGRALKQQSYRAKEAEYPVKMIRVGKDYVAISNMRGGKGNAEHWARLAWYDRDGKFRHEKVLKDGTFDYDAMGIVPATDGAGFVAILHAVNRNDPGDENGVLMRFTPGGDTVWRRAYRPGVPNQVSGLTAIDKSTYIATGRIRLEDGRLAGWAMRLGSDGAMQWQRSYPRGAYSMFRDAALVSGGNEDQHKIMLSGDAMPLDNGPRAAWVMEIDRLGEPQWQRYFRREDFDLTGEWIRTEEDGRRMLMMNAVPAEGKLAVGHIRILTLSPRGDILGDESYYTGLKAKATDYVTGTNGERIFTADIEVDAAAVNKPAFEPIVIVGLAADPEAQVPEAKEPEKPVHQGWVLVATAPDPYNDPCP